MAGPCTWLSETEQRAIAAEHLGRGNARVAGVHVRPLGGPRAGYMGDHLKLAITVQVPGDEDPTELPFFVKRMPTIPVHRYAPPATDVLILLHTLTSVAFREEHGSRMYDAYYQEVTRELERHSLQADALFPRKEFDDSCDFYRVLGKTWAAACSQMTLLRPGFTDDIFRTPDKFFHFMLDDRSEEVLENFRNDDVYRSRVIEAMEEFIDTCILKEEGT